MMFRLLGKKIITILCLKNDELSLGPEPTIASMSFEDARNFELRKKPPLVSKCASTVLNSR